MALNGGARIDMDEEPRQSSMETLAALKTPFKEKGTVTAANSSGVSDGACMAAICEESVTHGLGVDPLVKISETVTVGLDPTLMGLGPIYAIRRLLNKTNLTLRDIDLFEINEAFAVQVIACRNELGIDPQCLNINGGAVALGHPLGMSGLRIAISLAHTMKRNKAQRGIASMCVGHGQGVAMLLERESSISL